MSRKRHLRIKPYGMRTDLGWSTTTLRLEQSDRAVTIEIGTPYQLRYLRAKLNEIENHWRKVLEASKP